MSRGPTSLEAIWPEIERASLAAGAIRVGACGLTDSHVEHFERWLDEGLEAGMSYLRRNLAVRREPLARFPQGRSAIVVLVPYQAERPAPNPDNIAAYIARYAQGDDYHDVVEDMLRSIESTVTDLAPGTWTWRYVDTGPLSDRSLAVQAGLGWIGRNGMLIDPEIGSWHFIGVLLTSLELDHESTEVADRCGECTACVTACPTDAIRADRLVDSNRCLSYLTIEHRGALPAETDDFDFAGNIFGCDICQEVCPWNERPPDSHPAFETRPALRDTPVHDLLRTSQEGFSTMFRRSAVKRAKRAGLIRNTIRSVGTDFSAVETLASETDVGIRAALAAVSRAKR